MVKVTAMIASSVRHLDRDTYAVTRCDFAAGNQPARLRQAEEINTTVRTILISNKCP